MTANRIATIVEGHGEVEAVPILLRRIAERVAPGIALEVPRPIRVKRHQIVKAEEMARAVALAVGRAGPHGSVLVLLDADDDCPAVLASGLLRFAEQSRPDCSIRVVLAKAEYESWFLAAAASLAGHRGIDEAASPPPDSEAIRDAKGWLSARMPPGRRYRETLHQAALTARFDLDSARAAPSFDKMWRDLASLLGGPGLTSAGSRS